MAKGKTLYEMLKTRLAASQETKIDNPLKVRIGGVMTINSIDYDGLVFNVQTITEYRRSGASLGLRKDLTFTDYDLLARPYGKDDVRVKVRLMPTEGKVAETSHNVLVLKVYDELPYNEGLHGVVKAGTKVFDCFNDGVLTAKYFRINDLNDPYTATLKVLKDEDGNGKVDEDEVATRTLEYWDYWREIKDEAGQAFNDYCFVEMDTETGYFQIWTGSEVDSSRVAVL